MLDLIITANVSDIGKRGENALGLESGTRANYRLAVWGDIER